MGKEKVLEPEFVSPMLAKLVLTLPEGPQWEYELKLDGYRLRWQKLVALSKSIRAFLFA